MSCTPQEFRQALNQAAGGSDTRYLHPFNRRMTFSNGMKNAADVAGGHWFIDPKARQAPSLQGGEG